MRSFRSVLLLFILGLVSASCSDSSEKNGDFMLLSILPLNAMPGETVILSGMGFEPGMQVCFGEGIGMCSEVLVTDSNTGTAIVPSGAGTNLSVRIVMPDGTSYGSDVVFSYGNAESTDGNGDIQHTDSGSDSMWSQLPDHEIISDSPRIDKMTPTGGRVGSAVTIVGTNLGTANQVCFGSSCTNISPSQDKIIVNVPEGSGNVLVNVVGAGWSIKAGYFSYIEYGTQSSDVNVLPMVEWCRINAVQPNAEVGHQAMAYAEVFKDGCTPDSWSKCKEMKGQIGYVDASAPSVRDPLTWTWLDANQNLLFSHENGNQNDEYMGGIILSNEGTYLVAFRYSMDGIHWTYCDYDSSSNGFSPDQAGRLTVSSEKPMEIKWCRIVNGNTNISSNINEDSEAVYAQFFVSDDCTKDGTKCPNLMAQIGYGNPRFSTVDEIASSTNYTWKDTTFNALYDGSGGKDHNEFMGTVSTSVSGSYSVLFRGSVDGGKTWTYCDTSDNNSFSAGDAIKWEVKGNASNQNPNGEQGQGLDWCNIQYPQSSEIKAGETLNVYGRVYVSGCTDGGMKCDRVIGQLGYGTGDNAEGFTWTNAVYNPSGFDIGNNNEFMASIKPTAAGQYRYGYRFSVDNGQSWRYCDTDGNVVYNNGKLGYLTVSEAQSSSSDSKPKTWCRIQHPDYMKVTIKDPPYWDTDYIYGRIYVDGVTGKRKPSDKIHIELCWSKEKNIKNFTCTESLQFNYGYQNTDNTDEYTGRIFDNGGEGTYYAFYRFSYDNFGPQDYFDKDRPWEYCDYDDEPGFDVNKMLRIDAYEKKVEEPTPEPHDYVWGVDYECGYDSYKLEAAAIYRPYEKDEDGLYVNPRKPTPDDTYLMIRIPGCTGFGPRHRCEKVKSIDIHYRPKGSSGEWTTKKIYVASKAYHIEGDYYYANNYYHNSIFSTYFDDSVITNSSDYYKVIVNVRTTEYLGELLDNEYYFSVELEGGTVSCYYQEDRYNFRPGIRYGTLVTLR